jgi:hypothetical protein
MNEGGSNMTSYNVQSFSTYVSIRAVHSQGMLLGTQGYEKTGPPFISIDNLQIIGRITRSIKGRIESAIDSFSLPGSFGAGLAVGSHAPFSETGSAYFAQ